jgi:hypothetical protein
MKTSFLLALSLCALAGGALAQTPAAPVEDTAFGLAKGSVFDTARRSPTRSKAPERARSFRRRPACRR